VKGSKNWEKCRIKLAKAYEKLVNQRNDFLHKLSRFYVNNYDVIIVGDLGSQNMVRVGRTLAQRILDASWGKFIQLLSYKAERAGRRVVKVNPRGTSEGLTMGDPYRDYISACRIKSRGRGPLSACGEETSTPYNLRNGGCHGASFLCEAGSPLRKRGVVHICLSRRFYVLQVI